MRIRNCSILLLFLCACTEKVDITTENLYLIRKPSVTEINTSGSTFSANIENLGNAAAERHGFVWSTAMNPNLTSGEIEDLGTLTQSNFSARIESRLTVNEKYYVRAFAKIAGVIFLSDTTSFISLGSN